MQTDDVDAFVFNRSFIYLTLFFSRACIKCRGSASAALSHSIFYFVPDDIRIGTGTHKSSYVEMEWL